MKTALISLAIALIVLPLLALAGYALLAHEIHLIAQLLKGIQ